MSCKNYQEIKLKNVEGISLNKITTEKIEAEIKLRIENPNPIGLSIYRSEFDIVYSGIRLGKAKLKKRVHIKRKTEGVYTFILKSNISDLNPLDAIRLLNLDNMGKIELKGDLKVGKFFIRKKFPINYTDKVNIFTK